MQTRLLACLGGGFLGIVVASPINSALGLGLSSGMAMLACSAVGIALGCVASLLIDVFTTSSGDQDGQT